ncbi:protein NLRC3-like [Antennarius striatus]|uniref:protein NLRC3-like n=1 Tax=Antennarius striatus TaxID=241820 RepID=UPI0035ADC2AC
MSHPEQEERFLPSTIMPSEKYDNQNEQERTKQERPRSPRHHASIDVPVSFRRQDSNSTTTQERTDSPRHHTSIDVPISFKRHDSNSLTKQERTESPGRHHTSIDVPMAFRRQDSNLSIESESNWSSDLSPPLKNQEPTSIGHQQTSHDVRSSLTELGPVFTVLEENLIDLVKNELKDYQRILSPGYQEYLGEKCEDSEVNESETEEPKSSSRHPLLKITLVYLRSMKQEKLADLLQNRTDAPVCHRKLKSNLKRKFECMFEGIAKGGHPIHLNEIYTELYITEGGASEVSHEHEVRQIELWKTDRTGKTIRYEDIFKGSPERAQPIRTLMTKGVAGIGNTVLTKKFTLDWAEGKANQDIQFIFPFTFKELNVLKHRKYSLVGLIHDFFNEIKEAGLCRFEEFQVLFIFDGLDESRIPLDFNNSEVLTDVTATASINVLLTNLFRRNLLPSARLWITTRPAAANQIPPEYVDMVAEVRGFTDPQKEEYFRKRFGDKDQANRIISHFKTSQSLHVMCHIPIFCWIMATVLETTNESGELPTTLTEMYIHFLVVQSKLKNIKYDGGAVTDPHWNPESRMIIASLGRLAFEQLQKDKLIFYESDLKECGIDVKAALVYSGVFTQIFKEARGLYQEKVFCFIHLSVQEFLAALHVHMTFFNLGVNLLSKGKPGSRSSILAPKETPKAFYRSAVDVALKSPNGHLDLFLRFLIGLSLPANQTLLKGLVIQMRSNSVTDDGKIKYIKKKLNESLSPERSINLFHCLNELRDCSLMEEIQQYLHSGRIQACKLSPAQWSALVFILLSSEKDLDVFDLRKYSDSEEALLTMLPVVKVSAIAQLSGCNLSKKSCGALARVLSSQSCRLKELDLSDNNLKDSGLELLCSGLKSPHCTLEVLRLSGCHIKSKGCTVLANALRSNPSHLRELDLSYNHLGDSGVKLLSDGQKNPNWRLEKLKIEHDGLNQ